MVPRLGFGEALDAIKNGCKATRRGWNGKGMWIALRVPGDDTDMTREYVYMKTVDDQLVPWVASQTDLLAEDWEIINENE